MSAHNDDELHRPSRWTQAKVIAAALVGSVLAILGFAWLVESIGF